MEVKMNTTISVSNSTKEEIMELGRKGETYDEILARILSLVKERQLQEILMDEKETVTVREALERAKKRWLK